MEQMALALIKSERRKRKTQQRFVESDEVSYETARGPDWMPSNRSSTLYLILQRGTKGTFSARGTKTLLLTSPLIVLLQHIDNFLLALPQLLILHLITPTHPLSNLLVNMFGLWASWSLAVTTLGKLANPNNFTRTIEMNNKALNDLNKMEANH